MGAEKGDPKERQDYSYDVREDAFEAARSLRKAGPKSTLTGQVSPLPEAEARRRLFMEYGQLLVGRGYKRQAVKQMIERALNAAGW